MGRSDSPLGKPNRRKSRRFEKHLPVSLQTGKDVSIECYCINLSRSGLYCVSDYWVAVGESVKLGFGLGFCLEGEVVRVEELDEGSIGFGVEFPGMPEEVHTGDPTELPEHLESTGQIHLKSCHYEAFRYYRRLQPVLKRVQEGTEGICLDEAAKLANMERTYFSDFFHQKVGITFSSWIQYVRIAKALDILRTTNSSLTEVALESGFNDVSTFNKAFKRWTGLTPGEVKRLIRPA